MASRWLHLAIALLACGPALSQERTGSSQGSVVDASGGPVVSARIEVRGPALAGISRTTTDSEGRYLFGALPPGEYTVLVFAQDFSPSKWTRVRVVLSERLRLDAQLALAVVHENVTVTAETPPLDGAQSLTSESFAASLYAELPNSRSADSLAALSPGVVADAKAGGTQIDGASGAENVFVVDGVDASSIYDGTLSAAAHIPPEWIVEVQVKRNGLDSQFGGAVGGVINAVTRSGSNEYHGQASLYLGTSSLNAGPRSWLILNPYNDNTGRYFRPPRDKLLGLNPGYHLGGYLIRNHAWFFSSAYPVMNHLERSVAGTNYSSDERRDYTLNRIDVQMASRLRWNVAHFYNPGFQHGRLPNPLGTDAPATPRATEG